MRYIKQRADIAVDIAQTMTIDLANMFERLPTVSRNKELRKSLKDIKNKHNKLLELLIDIHMAAQSMQQNNNS